MQATRLRREGLVELDDVDVGHGEPARLSALRVAATGPMPMISGAQPETAIERTRASAVRPCSRA